MNRPTIELPTGLVRPDVKLTGTGGDVFAVIGKCRRALRDAGNTPDLVDRFTVEATSGDYEHVLQTCMAYCDVE